MLEPARALNGEVSLLGAKVLVSLAQRCARWRVPAKVAHSHTNVSSKVGRVNVVRHLLIVHIHNRQGILGRPYPHHELFALDDILCRLL